METLLSLYEPAEDSFLIQKHIKEYVSKEFNVLEIGTGTGILAIEAAKYAKFVLAVDIQKEVIRHCKKIYFKITYPNITWKQSNLFEKVPKRQFDCIIFNPPYLPHHPKTKDITLDGGKKGYEIIEQFLNKANDYIKMDGTILLLFSSLTKKDKIDEIIKANCFEARQIDTQKIAFEILYVYTIKKSKLLKNLEQEEIINVKRFAKGKRGIIYKAQYQNKKVIIKVKNPKSTAMSTILFESDWLKKLNKYGIGPKVCKATQTFIAMEFLEGSLFKEYIKKNTKKMIKAIIKKLMQQLYQLDSLGINKQEMKNPYKHIIIKNHNPTLIDFERSRYTKTPCNITQFCQYLTSKTIAPILEVKGIIINKEKIQAAAKIYKKERSKKNYNNIIKVIMKRK